MEQKARERQLVEGTEEAIEKLTGVEYLKAKFFMRSVAEAIGMTAGAMHQWGDTVPEARVIEVSRVTGVPPHKIRPDLYDGYVLSGRESC